MFLRKTQRKKDGKTHTYWSVVENQRVARGRAVQRHSLYLGEINASQAAAWRRAVEGVDSDTGQSQALSLFPQDRGAAVAPDASVVQFLTSTYFEINAAGRGRGRQAPARLQPRQAAGLPANGAPL